MCTARSDVGKGDDAERGAVPCRQPRSRGRRDGSPDLSEAKVLSPLFIPEPLRASLRSSAKWGENNTHPCTSPHVFLETLQREGT